MSKAVTRLYVILESTVHKFPKATYNFSPWQKSPNLAASHHLEVVSSPGANLHLDLVERVWEFGETLSVSTRTFIEKSSLR